MSAIYKVAKKAGSITVFEVVPPTENPGIGNRWFVPRLLQFYDNERSSTTVTKGLR